MSQSNMVPITDTFMLQHGATMPQQAGPIQVDPQYGSIRLVSPYARISYANLAAPKQVRQSNGSLSDPQFSGTLLFNPVATVDIYKAIVAVATHRFAPEQRPNPQNPSEMVMMTAEHLLQIPETQGGLHYPLRQGEQNYMRDPKRYELWRPYFFINASLKAKDTKGNPQNVVCKDENGYDCDPSKIQSGDYVRAQLTFFAYPKAGAQGMGSRGVSVSLNAVQFVRKGDRMGGFDASKAAGDAFAAAGALPAGVPVEPANTIGYGSNNAGPGSMPPGTAVPGFAAPQPQAQPNQGFAAPNPGFVPPNANPASGFPPAGGARPPGV